MKSKYVKIMLFGCFLFSALSCNKTIEAYHWEAQLTHNKVSSITELLYQEGSDKMIKIVASKNKNMISLYNKNIANQIASYIMIKYKIDIRDKFIDNPEGIIILGMFFAAREHKNRIISKKSDNIDSKSIMLYDDNMNCFITAVSDVIGITQAKSLWASIVAGATEETIIAAVSLIGRRVAGLITVTFMVYSTGECLGWW